MTRRVKKSKRHPVKDNAPIVILALLAVVVVAFIIFRGVTRSPDEGWKNGLKEGQPPAVAELPPKREVFGRDQMLQLPGWDGARLAGLDCRWCLRWRLPDPPAELDLLFFDKIHGAQQALELGEAGREVRGLGAEGVAAGREIRFREGRVVVRLAAPAGAAVDPGQLELKAREISRMVMRSFGRFP